MMMKMKTKEQLLKEFEELKAPMKENINCVNCFNCFNCSYCSDCLKLYNGILCKGLKFGSFFYPNKFWVLNKKVSEEEFDKVKEIMK